MSATVYRISTMLSSVLQEVPVGTNLALFHLLWTLLSGRLLTSRGAVIPALADFGLPAPAVRRAWAALAYGDWECGDLLARWRALVLAAGQWQPRCHGGYRPVAADLVGFFRPRLQDCPTTHYSSPAGKALPALPFGMLARIGAVGGQRLPLPVSLLRPAPDDPSEAALQAQLVQAAVAELAEDEALVVDGGFSPARLLGAGLTRFVLRVAKNFTARRATLPERKRGRPPERGEWVRPLARQYKGKTIPATPADREESLLLDRFLVRLRYWENLVLADAKPGAPPFTCLAIDDPRYAEPLLVISPLPAPGAVILALYQDRWPVEQWPLSAKQMLGGVRQFVFAPESRQRLPELLLLAGSLLSHAAATLPAVPSGFWDRQPRPTPGRLRRALAGVNFADLGAFPARFRKKASPTAHLPKGVRGHRRRKRSHPNEEASPLAPEPLPLAA
ncbi:MAG TPA: hypothetical protein VJO72_01985 [Candidatus Dormibacteraeota bacterium]|nr:hypothetical protein [Candidatus Dormibacteraeota bacterium]